MERTGQQVAAAADEADGGQAGRYRRDVGTAGLVFLVINGMVGAGIFGLPELLHQAVGTFAPWLILAGALFIGTVTICFASLSRLTDRSGGPSRYVTDAFGFFPGFQIGWLLYFARMLAQAANVIVLLSYLSAFFPGVSDGLPRSIMIVAIIAAITILNVVGIRRAVTVLGIITFFKLVPLIVLVGMGVVAAPDLATVQLPQFSAVEGVALAAIYAFVGFENATVPAGEASDPKRSMPRAILIGLAVVALLYFGLQFIYSNSPIAGSGSEAPLAALAAYHAGDVGALILSATVVVSVLANMIAGHTTGSRMSAALADDRSLPGWFGRVSRWGTPANSIGFFGFGALLFALSGTFVALAVGGTLARLIVYIASIAALPRLRRLRGLSALTATTMVAAPIALLVSLWATFQSTREQWLLIAAFVAFGSVLFAVARTRRRNAE